MPVSHPDADPRWEIAPRDVPRMRGSPRTGAGLRGARPPCNAHLRCGGPPTRRPPGRARVGPGRVALAARWPPTRGGPRLGPPRAPGGPQTVRRGGLEGRRPPGRTRAGPGGRGRPGTSPLQGRDPTLPAAGIAPVRGATGGGARPLMREGRRPYVSTGQTSHGPGAAPAGGRRPAGGSTAASGGHNGRVPRASPTGKSRPGHGVPGDLGRAAWFKY